ncbi:response regulator [Paenibacillus sp. JX-17]|uniref:Response regulator n=1 Tax=Paenibacillus lacisoli TaxID=3064525 RepID=A0ABT9CAN8_9BACL|nr:response regulator [Paenibacillus sp. JX-17]MDO7906329.1 response regulator [Paenibacillus sp. JX-17]
MIDAYLVENNRLELDVLTALLGETGGIRIAGSTIHADAAIQEARRLQPQALFINPRLTGVSGMDLAVSIRRCCPDIHIIYITPFKEHALLAYEQQAFDYILKPLAPERVKRTVQRLVQSCTKEADTEPV